ncbi:MAG TPA: LamG-like jellyroll fold domain-containing protein, partial [Longimicrobium sp.]|nr:LamG-like jellyroll fold domain-containing protein [Longimicrobium sp.]
MIVFNKTHALLFDGGHVSLGVHADYDLEQALTFAAWVRPGSGAGQHTLLSKAYTSYEPQVQGGRWVFERGPEYAGDTPVDPDRWTHLAVTFDAAAESGNVRLYVNGVLDRTHDVRSPLARSGEPLLMGTRPSWDDEGLRFRGQIAEMALWNTAHSAWQIAQEMNSRPNPLAADLVGWWAMDDGDGSTVSDRGPRGHHGTIQGNVSWVRLAEPIAVDTPGRVPLTAAFAVASAPLPEGTTQMASAPRVALPPSGRNGEARKFLDRAGLAAQAQKQAQAQEASTRLQQAREGAAEHLDAAHREAARLMNTARFDVIWFLYGSRIHQSDAQGRITPYRSSVPQVPGAPGTQPETGSTPPELWIDARAIWQRTGVRVSRAARLTLRAEGVWGVSPQFRSVGPQGAYSMGRGGYALPGAPEGALVGRVGGHTFLVGAGATVPEGVEGELELAANDDVGNQYGNGYGDNSGSMLVRLTEEPAFLAPAADLAVDPARGRVFWALPFTPFSLYSASVKGGELRTLVAHPGGPVASVAVDVMGQRLLYLTDAGVLAAVPYEGGDPQALLDLSGARDRHEWQLAVDADNGRVYWTGPLGIWSAALDGGDPRMVIPPHEAPAPVGVAVDGTAGKLYWVDAELHRVRRGNLDGTGVEDLYDAPHPVRGLALDEVVPELPELKQEVYWSAREERILPRTPGIVGHWPLDEGEGRTVRNRARPSVHSNLGAWRRDGDDLPPPMRPPETSTELRGGSDGAWLAPGSVDALLDASFTVEVWVRPTAVPVPGEVTLLWAGESQPGRGLHLALNDGRPYMGFGGNDTAGQTVLAADRWVHLAFRYDRDRQEQAIFVDGVLDRAETGHPPLQGNAGLVASVGRALVGEPRPFSGRMAGLHVTARAMTEPEIRACRADARPADLLAALAQDPAWADDDAPPVVERPESVLVFGGGGHVKLGTARAMGFTGGSFTVEAWVRPDSLEGDVPLLGMEEAVNSRGLHLIIRRGKPYLGFYADDLAGGTQLAAGEWVHLAFRYDASTREQAIFVNGAPDGRR